METLCEKCIVWVDCGKKGGEPHGFCLYEDLFTYTARKQCNDYVEGKPATEEQWEQAQSEWLGRK